MSYSLYKVVNFGPGRAALSTVGYTLTGGSRITAGVAEIGTATGVYGATVTFAGGFAGSILWDTGQGGSTVYGAEDINPGPENLDAKVTSRLAPAGTLARVTLVDTVTAATWSNPEALTGTVVSATLTSVTISPGPGVVFNTTANAYTGQYLTFTTPDNVNRSFRPTITASATATGNCTLTFATPTGFATPTAGHTVQID